MKQMHMHAPMKQTHSVTQVGDDVYAILQRSTVDSDTKNIGIFLTDMAHIWDEHGEPSIVESLGMTLDLVGEHTTNERDVAGCTDHIVGVGCTLEFMNELGIAGEVAAIELGLGEPNDKAATGLLPCLVLGSHHLHHLLT